MDADIQNHILDNLKELNTAVGGIAQGQKDMAERFEKIVPWVKDEVSKVDTKAEANKNDILTIKDWQKTTAWKLGWKLGMISAGAGAGLTFVGQWVLGKFGIKVH